MKIKTKNATLVITDPCYIKHGAYCLMKRNTIYGDWSCMVFPGNLEENSKTVEEWAEIYIDFFNEYNFTGKSSEEKKKLYDEFESKRDAWIKDKGILGEFCADSGMVGVFDWNYMDDEDREWCKSHPWCATIIENWTGEVDIKVIDESVHVVGYGDRPFFSAQTGF